MTSIFPRLAHVIDTAGLRSLCTRAIAAADSDQQCITVDKKQGNTGHELAYHLQERVSCKSRAVVP